MVISLSDQSTLTERHYQNFLYNTAFENFTIKSNICLSLKFYALSDETELKQIDQTVIRLQRSYRELARGINYRFLYNSVMTQIKSKICLFPKFYVLSDEIFEFRFWRHFSIKYDTSKKVFVPGHRVQRLSGLLKVCSSKTSKAKNRRNFTELFLRELF